MADLQWTDTSGGGTVEIIEATGTTTNTTPTTIQTLTLESGLTYVIEFTVIGREVSGSNNNAGYLITATFDTTGSGAVLTRNDLQAAQETEQGWNVFLNVSGFDVLVKVIGPAYAVTWKSSARVRYV